MIAVAGVWLFLVYLSGARSERELKALYKEMPASAAQALAHPAQVTLYSLEPWANYDSKKGVRGHKILGQIALDKTETAKAVAAFRDAVVGVQCSGWFPRECRGPPIALCFNPRH